jgi:hypothetical protein
MERDYGRGVALVDKDGRPCGRRSRYALPDPLTIEVQGVIIGRLGKLAGAGAAGRRPG